jgi:hypothetical protein
LNEIQHQIQDKATLFWLDAHWCSAEETDEHISQCPLLQEIQAIQKLNIDSIILIDDARLFTCPPPKPHVFSEWPRFNAILDALLQISDRHQLIIYNDVIIYYPDRIDNAINQYAYENSVDWLQIKHLSEFGQEFKKQFEVMDQDLSLKDIEIQNKQQALLELQGSLLEKEKEIQSISREANARLSIINDQLLRISDQSEEINRLNNIIQTRNTNH